MNRILVFTLPSLLIAAANVYAAPDQGALIITASNAAANQLLVYDTNSRLVQTVATGGKGGVSGNAGGIEALGAMLAVVNFGSQNVSVFERSGNGFHLTQLIPAASNPVSVAFGNGHLYVLGTTRVESHRIFGAYVSPNPDGVAPLYIGDGSAAQVGVVPNQLVITEKSNVIETVGVDANGAVTGAATLVKNLPNPANAPFGLVTRGDNAYVTIAHSDEIALVRNGEVLTITGSGSEHAPCWLTLAGPFLFSSNSPSMSISRFAVFGRKIVQDEAKAATFAGAPTDIASRGRLLAVIDGFGSGAAAGSHVSIFMIDEEGGLTLKSSATVSGAVNGVAIVSSGGLD